MKKFSKYLLIFIFIMILLEKLFNPYDSYNQNLNEVNIGILKNKHILGTDYLGRDLFSRLSDGIILSMMIVILVIIISLVISLILGYIMGYFGRIFDEIFMFIIEIFMSIPSILVVIFILIFFGNSVILLVFSLSLNRSLRLSLLVRNEVKKIKLLNFVSISKLMGASNIHILRKHILPNIIPIVLVRVSVMIPGIIFSEAFLSFMGIGIRLPKASLGNLISTGFNNIFINPTQFILSSVFLILLTFSFGGLYEDNGN